MAIGHWPSECLPLMKSLTKLHSKLSKCLLPHKQASNIGNSWLTKFFLLSFSFLCCSILLLSWDLNIETEEMDITWHTTFIEDTDITSNKNLLLNISPANYCWQSRLIKPIELQILWYQPPIADIKRLYSYDCLVHTSQLLHVLVDLILPYHTCQKRSTDTVDLGFICQPSYIYCTILYLTHLLKCLEDCDKFQQKDGSV